jgi:hypothetical protein
MTMNNQPAFPSTHHNGWGEPEKGMTLRDYFAAKAMQGMLSENSGIRYPTDELAEIAYMVADEMLKAREA